MGSILKKLLIGTLIGSCLIGTTYAYYPNPRQIIIHHQGDNSYDKVDRMEIAGIYDWHINNNNWNYIGYDYVIERYNGNVNDGEQFGCKAIYIDNDIIVWETPRARESLVGGHTKGANSNSIGIAIAGDYDRDYLDEDILNTTTDFINNYIYVNEGILKVVPHRDIQEKSCPGSKFPLAKLRSILQGYKWDIGEKINNKYDPYVSYEEDNDIPMGKDKFLDLITLSIIHN